MLILFLWVQLNYLLPESLNDLLRFSTAYDLLIIKDRSPPSIVGLPSISLHNPPPIQYTAPLAFSFEAKPGITQSNGKKSARYFVRHGLEHKCQMALVLSFKSIAILPIYKLLSEPMLNIHFI